MHVLRSVIFILTALCGVAFAQGSLSKPKDDFFEGVPPEERAALEKKAMRLWEGDAPGARGKAPEDIPILYPVCINKEGQPHGVVIVLCGGAYVYHSSIETFPVARMFGEAGLSTFVLEYRINPYTIEAPLRDLQRAVRLVRSKAAELNIDPNKISLIGYSAGGHLAANLSTHSDDGDPKSADPVERQSCRVQATMLIYPGIIYREDVRTEKGPRPISALLDFPGIHQDVTAKTAPAFMVVGIEDDRTPYENCLAYAIKLHEAGVRFELHILGSARHGKNTREQPWLPFALTWLRTCHVL
jgi:acetyl esterase/lipase